MFDFESDKVDPRFSPDHTGEQPDPPAKPTPQPETAAIIAPPPIPLPPPLAPSAPAGIERRAQPSHPRKTVRLREWAWVGAALGMMLAVIVVGLGLVALVNARGTPTEEAAPVAALPTPVDARVRYEPNSLRSGQQVTLDDGSSIVLQPWNGTSRLNILLLGIDRRPGETGLGYRSDTMMLASFDPETNSLGILSIPRDLYVQIPGYSAPQRINTALALGELQRPGYGPTLAMQTVQYKLGIGVNAYLLADFTALIRLVDAIGGIDIDVPTPLADYDFPDMYYGYDPLILSAGMQHMDGYTAQKYARTRHGDSDFDRARRQQQVLYAIRDRILSFEALPQLIIQAPSLYASIEQNVSTELSLEQMIRLGLWLKDLPAENIHTGVIDQHYVSDFTTEDGAEVLVPYKAALPTLLAQVFGSSYNQ